MFGFGGADYRVPLYAFVFLVTLGIDYNIFLMTRVREQAARRETRRGALVGLAGPIWAWVQRPLWPGAGTVARMPAA